MSAARIAKGHHVVEAAQGKGNHPNKANAQPSGQSGVSDTTRTIQRVRATRRVRVRTGKKSHKGATQLYMVMIGIAVVRKFPHGERQCLPRLR
jgi:hypothetical protein